MHTLYSHTWKFGSQVELISKPESGQSQRPHTHLPRPLQTPWYRWSYTVYHQFHIARWHSNLNNKALLTPLLSRQVWLLLGHSQALPVQPSIHAHRPMTQEPRSDRKRKRNCFKSGVNRVCEHKLEMIYRKEHWDRSSMMTLDYTIWQLLKIS